MSEAKSDQEAIGDSVSRTGVARAAADGKCSRVSEEAARAKPLAGAHSIWEIVNHVTAWYDEAMR